MDNHVSVETRKKWAEFFRRLEYGTTKKSIKWKTTSSDTDVFSKIGENVILFGTEFRNNRPFYYIQIETNDGRKIESFDDEELGNIGDDINYFDRMKELFAKINRELSGADKVLEDLIKLLPDPDEEIPF